MWSARPLSIPAGLFAQWRFDLDLIVYGILLILLIVAGCLVVVRVRRWRDEQGAPLSLEDQINNYQELVERGELDLPEFERIKAHLLQAQLPEGQAAESSPPSDTRIQAAPEHKVLPPVPPDTRIQAPPSGQP